MLNEVVFLQISLILMILLLYNMSDPFNSNMVGILYLLTLSLYSLYFDLDVFIGFLLVIDLGIFFVMFTFVISLSRFLNTKNPYNSNYRYNFYNLIIFISVFTFNTFFYYNDSSFNKFIENTWFFYVSYYNFYDINNSYIVSEMQALKEIYFNFNNFEFFVISILIYFAVFISFFLLNFLNKISYGSTLNFTNFFKNNKSNSSYFFRYQNFSKQSNTKPSTKVWFKKI